MHIHAAGCIPFMRRGDGREVVALMILRRGGFWEFPKGKQEDGESDEETAVRETEEEVGLTGELVNEPPIDLSYRYERNKTVIDKTVRYFFLRVQDGSVPKLDSKEVNDCAWISLENLADRATYPEMKEVARDVWRTLAD